MINCLVGILIGLTINIWWAILLIAFVWGVFVCIFMTIIDPKTCKQSIQSLSKKYGQEYSLWDSAKVFYLIEFLTAFTIALSVGSIFFYIQKAFT